MATQPQEQTVDQSGIESDVPSQTPQPDPRPAVFKMSALHPLAGKASAAGTAPNLRVHAAGLFPGSFTSGMGPEPGMMPKASTDAKPQSVKPARSRSRAKASAEPKQPTPAKAPRRMTPQEARAFLLGQHAPAGTTSPSTPRRTPPIPQDIRDLRLPGFTSVYELLPNEPRLFALESVYGRWDGQVLVLDSAPTHVQVVRARLERTTLRPYCQHETPSTYGLARLAFPLATRGVLAGTAFGPLLINSNERGDLVANRETIRKAIAPTLRFVTKNMPNLKAIVCMGATAYEFMLYAMTGKPCRSGTLPSTPYDFDNAQPIRPIFGGPTLFLTCRTSPEAIARRGGETKAAADWQAVGEFLTEQERPRALKRLGRGKVQHDIQAA